MHISELKEKYKNLVHDLHNLEKTIILLKGELKWNPSVSASQFRDYDGALMQRDHLEEKLYELDQIIRDRIDLSTSHVDCNNVIQFPCRSIN